MRIKIRKILSCLLFILTISGNSYGQDWIDFYFAEAQPRKEDVVKRFPATIRGLYKNDTDTTRRIRITGDSIVFEMPMIQYASFAELQTKNYTFQDTVLQTPTGKTLFCMLKNDTVFFVDYVQTVFFVSSNSQVLKKLNDYYVLSKQTAENKWECFLLYKENEKLHLAYFDHENKTEEIAANKRISLVKDKTPHYLANFKKKDFIKLIEKEFFLRKQNFTKRYTWQ